MTLPDCMMPDGADPCQGYAELKAENERLRELVQEFIDLVEGKDGLMGLVQMSDGYYQVNEYTDPIISKARAAIDAAKGKP